MANSAFEHTPSFTIPSSITTANSAAIWSAVNNLGQSTIILDSGGNGRIGISGDTNIITLTSGTVTVAGTVAATTLTGAGAGITALAAANITASGTLPALNGAALTALTAANITASGTLPALNGAALTALNGSQITTGTVADARISALTASKLTGALPAISGANLTNLPAGGITVNGTTDNALVTYDNGNTRLNTESNVTISTISENLVFSIGAYLRMEGQSTSISKSIQFRTTNGPEYEIEYRSAGLNFSEVGVAHYRLHIKDDGDVTVLENASSPSVVKGIAKHWVKFNPSSTGTLLSSYNCASVTDSNVGNWSVILTTYFSSTPYVITGMVETNTGISGGMKVLMLDGNPAGSEYYLSGWDDADNRSDPYRVHMVAFGERIA